MRAEYKLSLKYPNVLFTKFPQQNQLQDIKQVTGMLVNFCGLDDVQLSKKNDKCFIQLTDVANGQLFAECHATDTNVEAVVDSSRYFVLRIDDGKGRHAFIGLGFSERNFAFDFTAALSDFNKHSRAKEEAAKEFAKASQVDLSIPEGQKIHVDIKSKKGRRNRAANTDGGISLAPPPGNKTKTSKQKQTQVIQQPPTNQQPLQQPTGLSPTYQRPLQQPTQQSLDLNPFAGTATSNQAKPVVKPQDSFNPFADSAPTNQSSGFDEWTDFTGSSQGTGGTNNNSEWVTFQ